MPQIDTRLITSLPGQDIAQPDMSLGNFMQGFRMGMAKADPLEQLKRMEVEQALQMNAAKMADQMAVRQGMVELATVGADISSRGAWTDPTEKTKVFEVLKRNPMLATTGAAANVMGQFDVAEKLQQAEQLHTLRMETEKSRQTMYQGRATSGTNLSPPERRARALMRAEDEVSDAELSGDPMLLERAKVYRDSLNAAIKAEHRDPVEMTQLTLLRQRIASLNEQRANITLKQKWPEIETEMKNLQSQLDNWGKTPTPAQATFSTTETILDYRPGQPLR